MRLAGSFASMAQLATVLSLTPKITATWLVLISSSGVPRGRIRGPVALWSDVRVRVGS